MVTQEEAKSKVAKLVERYQAITPSELREYNEDNTKNGFIEPLFSALGWNVNDLSEMASEQRSGSGFADYSFRIQGVSRFVVEAKPLRDDLAHHTAWVKQAISYAYNRSIPWTVLTNFKQLWVFSGDTNRRQFLTLSADSFLADFHLLWLLGKESVQQGLLDSEVAKVGILPPRVPVEKQLYEQLSKWREELFRPINTYKPKPTLQQTDEAILKLFNRLIFIRTCEDRGLEDRVLQTLLRESESRRSKTPLMDGLKKIFRQFDNYYDSDLFAPHLIDQVYADDVVLAKVLKGLYEIPGGLANYDFSAIDADILGQVYEQYLGHVARVAALLRKELQLRLERGLSPEQAMEEVVEVVERPQRRKAQGIYYTPKWVVDYIVRQTVGKFIEENKKTPDRVYNLKILDPACGSGSFLIRAYDELLNWQAEVSGMPLEKLTHEYRMPLLDKNIYGVDCNIPGGCLHFLSSLGSEILAARQGPLCFPPCLRCSWRPARDDKERFGGVHRSKVSTML